MYNHLITPEVKKVIDKMFPLENEIIEKMRNKKR